MQKRICTCNYYNWPSVLIFTGSYTSLPLFSHFVCYAVRRDRTRTINREEFITCVHTSLGPRPSRDSRTKEGLGTLVDFLGTPARFGMVQSDCRISLITQLSRSNSCVTATQTPPPGHDSSRITRLLLKCACA